MGNSAFVIQLVSVLGASGVVGGFVTWVTGRRKNNADAAKSWNELIGTALDEAKDRQRDVIAESRRLRTKCDAVVDFCVHLVDKLESRGTPPSDVAELRAELRRLERMDEEPV